MIEGVEIHRLARHADPRGWLLKAVQPEHVRGAPFGEIYVVGFAPGVIRANHYHHRTTEWFTVLRGEGDLVLAAVDAAGQTRDSARIRLGVEEPVVVRVPPRVAHAIQNRGDEELILLAFADQPYSPDDPDTVTHVVLSPEPAQDKP